VGTITLCVATRTSCHPTPPAISAAYAADYPPCYLHQGFPEGANRLASYAALGYIAIVRWGGLRARAGWRGTGRLVKRKVKRKVKRMDNEQRQRKLARAIVCAADENGRDEWFDAKRGLADFIDQVHDDKTPLTVSEPCRLERARIKRTQ
jgi:hypothetical protein